MALDPARIKASAGQSFLFSPPLHIPRMLKPLEDQKLNDAAPGTEITEGEGNNSDLKDRKAVSPVLLCHLDNQRQLSARRCLPCVAKSARRAREGGHVVLLTHKTCPVQSAPASVLLNIWKDFLPSLCP